MDAQNYAQTLSHYQNLLLSQSPSGSPPNQSMIQTSMMHHPQPGSLGNIIRPFPNPAQKKAIRKIKYFEDQLMLQQQAQAQNMLVVGGVGGHLRNKSGMSQTFHKGVLKLGNSGLTTHSPLKEAQIFDPMLQGSPQALMYQHMMNSPMQLNSYEFNQLPNHFLMNTASNADIQNTLFLLGQNQNNSRMSVSNGAAVAPNGFRTQSDFARPLTLGQIMPTYQQQLLSQMQIKPQAMPRSKMIIKLTSLQKSKLHSGVNGRESVITPDNNKMQISGHNLQQEQQSPDHLQTAFDFSHQVTQQYANPSSPLQQFGSQSFSGTAMPTPFLGNTTKNLDSVDEDLQFPNAGTQSTNSPGKEPIFNNQVAEEGMSKEFLASLLNVGRPPMNKQKQSRQSSNQQTSLHNTLTNLQGTSNATLNPQQPDDASSPRLIDQLEEKLKNQGKILRKVPPKYKKKSKQTMNPSPPTQLGGGKQAKKDQSKEPSKQKAPNDSSINGDVTTEVVKHLNQDIFMIFNDNAPQTLKSSIQEQPTPASSTHPISPPHKESSGKYKNSIILPEIEGESPPPLIKKTKKKKSKDAQLRKHSSSIHDTSNAQKEREDSHGGGSNLRNSNERSNQLLLQKINEKLRDPTFFDSIKKPNIMRSSDGFKSQAKLEEGKIQSLTLPPKVTQLNQLKGLKPPSQGQRMSPPSVVTLVPVSNTPQYGKKVLSNSSNFEKGMLSGGDLKYGNKPPSTAQLVRDGNLQLPEHQDVIVHPKDLAKPKYMNARNRDEQYKRFLINITSTKSQQLKEQVLHMSKESIAAASQPSAFKNNEVRYPKVVMIEPTFNQHGKALQFRDIQ
ncbi:hypothetical protein FGO68_gene14724 [Halteria grandinella]|uniref:Uncharacterized protein n=1 Tax=Halteria grandinella TaxID=5974 RepID=A0A8J8P1B2_HALGN|nr:hypothetical protein FGO68_gene14724 [Halteria grandinella]